VAAVKASAKPATKPAVSAPVVAKSAAPVGAKLTTVSMVTTPALPEKTSSPDKKEVAVSQPAVAVSPVQTASKPATDYVFVEPSYKPKDETKTDEKPAPEPAVRALEAAAKFTDKPASALLPVNASSSSMQPQAAQAASTAIQPAVNLAAEQKTQMSQTPATNGPKYTGEPISVNLKDVDLKDFFRLIHEISGLNVVLDPNVHGSLTIVLDDVPWDQALDIVLKNNDLARELEGNVLRIATVDTLKKEADARRAQQESEALAVEKVTVTRFLSYAHSKDVVPTVKKFLSQRGDVISDDRTNAVIISDIPNVIPALDRLLTQLDRKTQ
jgi:type IV pilus assembly protein PilQ